MKYIIPLVLVILIMRYLIKKKQVRRHVESPQPEMLKQDPVCGAYVRAQPHLSLQSEAGVVYFCSETCKKRFRDFKSHP